MFEERTSRPDVVLVAILAAAAVAAVVVLGIEYGSRPTLERITAEDGPIEYATALVFLVAGALFIAAAVLRPVAKVWALLLGAGCVLVAGEEISWGQRLLGVSTPETFAAANVQGEINLHNLAGVNGVVRGAGVLALLAVFVALPVAVARWRWARTAADRFRVPTPPLTAIPILVIGLGFMVVPRLVTGGAVFRLDEVGELYVALVLLVFVRSVWRTGEPTGAKARRAVIPAMA